MRSCRISPIVFSIVLLGLAACGSDRPTATVFEHASVARAINDGKSFSGRCETAFAPPTLPPPPIIRQVDDGECQLSQLGRTAVHIVQDINIPAGTQQSVEITLTAANGDILRAATAGTNAPNAVGVAFQAIMTFTGGTGRFANATGQASVVGSANFRTNTASFTLDGWIAYGNTPEQKN
jgi:hypothetical protein